MPLVALGPDGFDLDLRYATADNITGRPIYRHARFYLHADAAAALGRAAALARAQGYRLRIFDAFRPTEAQWVLWRAFPDPEFVAESARRGLDVEPLPPEDVQKIIADDLSMSADVVEGLRAIMETEK